jgi:uncharacterized membrane protein
MFFILLFISPLSVFTVESEYIFESSELIVYRDGLVHVIQTLNVNETLPSISLTLLAPLIQNVIVLDENQTVLDFQIGGQKITIFSLGARQVSLEYDTISLTEKEAGVWTLILNNTYDISVHLPQESTIIYLNEIPTSIDTEDRRVTLHLFPSDWEISYVLPIISPAMFIVSDLSVDPTEVEVGGEVTISVLVSNIGEGEGSYDVVLRINQIVEDTKTIVLSSGASTTVEFKVTKEESGDYTVNINELNSEFMAKQAPLIPIFTLYLLIISTIVVTVIILVIFLRRKKPKAENIIKEHPYLRQEDREVIRFLQQCGNKAFESEIREQFPEMPRTSLWRLVRRLEKMDIVTIKRIGLQNQIRLIK